ncbi:MAG: hypothetical protein JXX14_18515 [Deltaproteobacteria bacterium]|nr:hypothetical protein [Deltaproteobacteria bacterium]
MSRTHHFRILSFVVVAWAMCISLMASAQANSDLVQKNKEAMDAYANLEIETAISLLQEAEQQCMDQGITGPELARTFVNRGVVEMGGNGDSALAMDYFKKGLCQDSTVLLDPLNSTPDMAELFSGAQAQVSSQGCDGIGPPVAGAEPTVDDLLSGGGSANTTAEPPTTPSRASEVVNDVLRHTPVTEQKKMVPIPFFVTTNDDIDVASVVTFYRTAGETIFQQLPMARRGGGWAAYIECDVWTTLDPSAIEYYIAVMDESGQLLSTAGSEAQPFTIEITDYLSGPAPTIPGEDPLPACQECPPWNPQCNERDCMQYSDACSDDEPCCSGLACVDGVCEESSGGGGEPGGNAATRVRIFLNGGIGLGLVPTESYSREDFGNMRSDGMVNTDKPGVGFSKLHYRVGVMIAVTEKLELGANFRGDMPLFSEHYPAMVPSVVANLGYRIAGSNAEKGFQMFAVFGFGWVNIMHRIPFTDCAVYSTDEDGDHCQDAPVENGETVVPWYDDPSMQVTTSGFRKAGFLGAEFGLDMNYWFVRNLGVNFGTIFDVTFPANVTLNLDVQLGLALRF